MTGNVSKKRGIKNIFIDGVPAQTDNGAVDIDLSGKLDVADYVDSQAITELVPDDEVTIPVTSKNINYVLKTELEATDIIIYADNLEDDIVYTFYLLLEAEFDSGIPQITFEAYKNQSDETPVSITWIPIDPLIEFPHTENLFAFQTIDGGHTWYANQCYSFEVEDD